MKKYEVEQSAQGLADLPEGTIVQFRRMVTNEFRSAWMRTSGGGITCIAAVPGCPRNVGFHKQAEDFLIRPGVYFRPILNWSFVGYENA